MKVSERGIDLIKSFEGLKLYAYKDSVGIPTIGYGTIKYEDGRKVTMGDVITIDRAEFLLKDDVEKRAAIISPLIKRTVNQNQFDALVSFAYNLGIGALRKSTLLKKVNINPADLSIKDEFLKWNRAGGRILPGLKARRQKEAELYFEE